MKKRGVLALAVIIVCSLLVYFTGGFQSKMYSKLNQASGANESETYSNKPNLIIVDTIKNQTILSVRTTINGSSVYDITTKLLANEGLVYKSNVTKDYIVSIAGLAEKSPEPESGWVFYINGKKSGIGAKSYIPQKTDIIEWKFLKDALSD